MPNCTKWKVEIIDASENDLGGYKEITAAINGDGVFARLKFESGVHRVQRVPATEASGRIHTSAATVAVLPEAEDVDLDIRQEDLRIDTMRASGAGGQHVNTTDSAVRITHVPTGIIVVAAEKSQHQTDERQCRSCARASMIWNVSGRRPNEPNSGVTKSAPAIAHNEFAHTTSRKAGSRIIGSNLTLHKLDQVLEGDGLDEIVDALITSHQASQLAAMDDA